MKRYILDDLDPPHKEGERSRLNLKAFKVACRMRFKRKGGARRNPIRATKATSLQTAHLAVQYLEHTSPLALCMGHPHVQEQVNDCRAWEAELDTYQQSLFTKDNCHHKHVNDPTHVEIHGRGREPFISWEYFIYSFEMRHNIYSNRITGHMVPQQSLANTPRAVLPTYTTQNHMALMNPGKSPSIRAPYINRDMCRISP